MVEEKRGRGRPRKKAEEVVDASANDESSVDVDTLTEQVQSLSNMVQDLLAEKAAMTETTSHDGHEEIKLTDYIKVVSLCPHILSLTTEKKGQGKELTFTKFGEKKRITYGRLIDIIDNHSRPGFTNFLEEGYYYIDDPRVVREHGLDDVYTRILTEEKIRQLLSGDIDSTVDLFKLASDSQKRIICDMIIEKMVDGEETDLNLVAFVSEEAGKDILQSVKDLKFYKEYDKNNKT